jgi:hypothetical protein
MSFFVFQLFQVFDKFVPCLKDPNSKVNLFALEVLGEIVPVIAPYFSNVATLTVTTVAANLASSKVEICEAAAAVLDGFVEFIGTGFKCLCFKRFEH